MAKHVEQQATFVQRLKTEFLSKTALLGSEYFAIIKRTFGGVTYEPFIHYMFDESYSVNESRIAIGLLKSQTSLDNPESCEFKIFKISNDGTPWVETLVKSGTLSLGADKLFKTNLTQAELGADLLGEVTVKIWVKITKGNEVFRLQKLFNHVGITDQVARLKRKLKFLEVTKKDFGMP